MEQGQTTTKTMSPPLNEHRSAHNKETLLMQLEQAREQQQLGKQGPQWEGTQEW